MFPTPPHPRGPPRNYGGERQTDSRCPTPRGTAVSVAGAVPAPRRNGKRSRTACASEYRRCTARERPTSGDAPPAPPAARASVPVPRSISAHQRGDGKADCMLGHTPLRGAPPRRVGANPKPGRLPQQRQMARSFRGFEWRLKGAESEASAPSDPLELPHELAQLAPLLSWNRCRTRDFSGAPRPRLPGVHLHGGSRTPRGSDRGGLSDGPR